VPAIFRWPGKIKAGLVSNEMISHLDRPRRSAACLPLAQLDLVIDLVG
jgi:hypothetical protein